MEQQKHTHCGPCGSGKMGNIPILPEQASGSDEDPHDFSSPSKAVALQVLVLLLLGTKSLS